VNSTVTPKDGPGDTTVNDSEVRLRISSVDDDSPGAEPATKLVFSSIQQTAVALVSAATEQAAQNIDRRSALPRGIRDAVAERREFAVQRATADQARRVADCARAVVESMLRHTTQPCLALNEMGAIIRWNEAISNWTGVSASAALEHDLTVIFSAQSADEIQAANVALREAEELPGGVDEDPVFVLEGQYFLSTGIAAERVALLPLCRVPRVVEAVIVLVTPASLPA